MRRRFHPAEAGMRIAFLLCGLVAIAFVLVITLYLILAGLPGFGHIGFWDFLLGRVWDPAAGRFGILPVLLASLYGAAGAILLGAPVGLLCAVFLAKVAPPRLAAVLRPAVEVLAGIPSVVYGLVGMLVLVPAVRRWFRLPDGASLFAAIVVLAVMLLPSVIRVAETALRAVPPEYEAASLALGATEIETVFRVSLPAASSGVAAAVILGVGRALGEAMAVLMVAGNGANMPGLFRSVRFLTTAVAGEMAYAAGLQREALFSIALVLFVFILLINGALAALLKGR